MIDDEEAEELKKKKDKKGKKGKKEEKPITKDHEDEDDEDDDDDGNDNDFYDGYDDIDDEDDEFDEEYDLFVNETVSREEGNGVELSKEDVKALVDSNMLARRSRVIKKLPTYDERTFLKKDESNKIEPQTYRLLESFKEFRREPIVQLTKGLIDKLPEAEETFRSAQDWRMVDVYLGSAKTTLPCESFLKDGKYPQIISYQVPTKIPFEMGRAKSQYFYFEVTVEEAT